MAPPTTWSPECSGIQRFPRRVAVSLTGMPTSLFAFLFVCVPLCSYAVIATVGRPVFELGVIAWATYVLYVCYVARRAGRFTYELDSEARTISIVSPTETHEIDLEDLECASAISLPGVTVVSTGGGWTETAPTWIAIGDADLSRVRDALSAVGIDLPTDDAGVLADPETTRTRTTLVVAGLTLAIVAPTIAVAALAVVGTFSPTFLGVIGLVFSGLAGYAVLQSIGVIPEYGESDRLGDTVRITLTRYALSLAGVGFGVGTFFLLVQTLPAFG